MEKTISNLRKECKANGIKLTIKTYSHGPHASFEVDGIRSTSIMTQADYDKRAEKFAVIRQLKTKYAGVTKNGNKVYGLK
jgi:dienelactone hydrolase